MKHITHILLLICMAMGLLGCQSDRPADLPKLYKCKVTVTLDGKPTEGVSVTLSPSDGAKWPAGGTTGQDGSAELTTNGRWPGAAAGKYKVILYKESVKVVGENVYETLLINAAYTSADSTPLEYTMEAQPSEVQFDATSR